MARQRVFKFLTALKVEVTSAEYYQAQKCINFERYCNVIQDVRLNSPLNIIMLKILYSFASLSNTTEQATEATAVQPWENSTIAGLFEIIHNEIISFTIPMVGGEPVKIIRILNSVVLTFHILNFTSAYSLLFVVDFFTGIVEV